MPEKYPLDTEVLRKIAVAASCDPRTVAAVASGRSVRGLAGERARKALVDAGYEIPKNGKKTTP